MEEYPARAPAINELKQRVIRSLANMYADDKIPSCRNKSELPGAATDIEQVGSRRDAEPAEEPPEHKHE
jgi:hypothetical protein